MYTCNIQLNFSKIYNSYNLQHATQYFQVFQLSLQNLLYIIKNGLFFQTLLYAKETSTYNFVPKVLENFTPTQLSQIVSLFQKIYFLKIFYSEAMLFSIALYQRNIYLGIVYLDSNQRKLYVLYNII